MIHVCLVAVVVRTTHLFYFPKRFTVAISDSNMVHVLGGPRFVGYLPVTVRTVR